MNSKLARNKAALGFTLIEVMISLALGLIVISGLVSIYLASLVSSDTTLSTSKLFQQTSALMNIITNDVRRAGYWGQGGTPLEDFITRDVSSNPFNVHNITALGVIDNSTSNTLITGNGATVGECLVYTYDSNENGVLNDADIVGFRLSGTTAQMRRIGNSTDASQVSCTAGTWEDLTDSSLISIDKLEFSLEDSVCLNLREPDTLDNNGTGGPDDDAEADCYTNPPTNGSGDRTVETLQINITIEASLVSDSDVRAQMNQIVKVRNERVRVW